MVAAGGGTGFDEWDRVHTNRYSSLDLLRINFVESPGFEIEMMLALPVK